ncbi:MAG: recombinase family protein [Thermoleophilia bacterium]|nr:recombinase family protein [Thermoleophilia bacterium]
MNREEHQKVTASHLGRLAYLYVRQSTLRQVLENTESTKRQYALRERAVALGWPAERVVIIDRDLGLSGADSDREGFQQLVAAVGMGEVGVVLGLEVSRLARSSSDWHRLLEICALSDTLILDEDGLYNPAHFNDRLLLGLKGTMSEAELHVLRARLIGGQRAKASRGELEVKLPVGLLYDPAGRVVLDPDLEVQQAVRTFFLTFRRTGSATGTVRSFREEGLLFPRRLATGPNKGELAWGQLVHSRALRLLKNPRYTGAFVYGRSRGQRLPGGKEHRRPLPREEWHTIILGAHPGYLTWEEYEENLARLRENAQANGAERRKSPPREGPALLQGLVLCGRCGSRMTVRYYVRHGELVPEYVCQREGIEKAEAPCQRLVGAEIDRAVGELLVETVTPLALEVALAVQEELETRAGEADRLRLKQVERARYEAELAQRRYLKVDPDNRLVAGSLEADWNQKLRAQAEAQEAYERERAGGGVCSARSNGRRSSRWPPTFPASGVIRTSPCGSASACSGSSWKTSPSCAATKSWSTSAFAAAPPRASIYRSPSMRLSCARSIRPWWPRSIGCSTTTHRCRDRGHPERPRPAPWGGRTLQSQDPLHPAPHLRPGGPLQPPSPTRTAYPRGALGVGRGRPLDGEDLGPGGVHPLAGLQ